MLALRHRCAFIEVAIVPEVKAIGPDRIGGLQHVTVQSAPSYSAAITHCSLNVAPLTAAVGASSGNPTSGCDPMRDLAGKMYKKAVTLRFYREDLTIDFP